MHASGQTERIHVQHWVVRVQQLLCHRAESGNMLTGGHRVLWTLLLRVHWWKLSSKWRRIRTWAGGFGRILIINHFGLDIVLLLYNYGIKTRTGSSIKRNWKGGGGSACQVVQCDFGMETGNKQPLGHPSRPSRCFRGSSLRRHLLPLGEEGHWPRDVLKDAEHAAGEVVLGAGFRSLVVSSHPAERNQGMPKSGTNGEKKVSVLTAVTDCRLSQDVPQ